MSNQETIAEVARRVTHTGSTREALAVFVEGARARRVATLAKLQTGLEGDPDTVNVAFGINRHLQDALEAEAVWVLWDYGHRVAIKTGSCHEALEAVLEHALENVLRVRANGSTSSTDRLVEAVKLEAAASVVEALQGR